jgi:hypothetical protein
MPTYETVTVIKSGEAWYRDIIRGLERIDAQLGERGMAGTDALTCWLADPEAFGDVVHGLVALGFPVAHECMALAGMPVPQEGTGRDDDRR